MPHECGGLLVHDAGSENSFRLCFMWNGYWCSHSWLVEAKGEGIDEGLVGGEDRGKREDVIIETCHQYSQDGRLHPGSFAAYYGIETSICRSQILH